jgi:glycosyltransferase involved in cell wall biosynthesis
MNTSNITIIIPAYNPSSDIGMIVDKIKNLYSYFEVIVVNNGSIDNTAEMAKKTGASVYSHPYNIGNGMAIKSGIKAVSGAVIVFMNGDGQYNPEDMERMVEFFPDYDVVVGARSTEDQAYLFHGIGNKALNRLAGYLAKFNIQDLTSGFRAAKSDIAHNLIYFLPNTYSYPSTITLGALRSGRSLKYNPSSIQKRKNGASRFRLIKDGIRFFMIVIKICEFYSPLRIFLPLSVVIFVLGLADYMFSNITSGRFSSMSLLIFTTSIIVFLMGTISEQITHLQSERSEGEKFE